MAISRLERSTNALLRDVPALREYCDTHGIPYSLDFTKKILPTQALRNQFTAAYSLPALPPTSLQQQGASTVLVFEHINQRGYHHGTVVAAVAEQVGKSLQPGVDVMFIHASPNASYRAEFQKKLEEPIKPLIENQGIPVIHSSIGWNDLYLDYDTKLDEQADHLWRCTAFLIDSAGNDGFHGQSGKWRSPRQKHNVLSHYAPLVVHVGAAVQQEDGSWAIPGYSSANSPSFVAPVAQAKVRWRSNDTPKNISGTSVSSPYVSGALAALNLRYGAYLTREQILYGVLATCTPVHQVTRFTPQTLADKKLRYRANAAGLTYNPEYGGFGLLDVYAADQLLGHMVARAMQEPKAVTVPTEKRVALNVEEGAPFERDEKGRYLYRVHMPAGIALKTTIEAEFTGRAGKVSITSPSGTSWPQVMSRSPRKQANFGVSTTHGWAGESLEGDWIVRSTQPINRLRLNQHHFHQRDLVQSLDIPTLLRTPVPDLSAAEPLRVVSDQHRTTKRILDEVELRGMTLNGERKELSDVHQIIDTLKQMPSGFAERHRQFQELRYSIDGNSDAGKLELEGNALTTRASKLKVSAKNAQQHADAQAAYQQAGETYMQAAAAYVQAGHAMPASNCYSMAGQHYLKLPVNTGQEGALPMQQAVYAFEQAMQLCDAQGWPWFSYRHATHLYSALSKLAMYHQAQDQMGEAKKYLERMPEVRALARHYSHQRQGGVDMAAHRIEEGEMGFSDHQRIGTDNVSQCIAVIAQDPVTLKTGIAHLDNEADIGSLDNFFARFGENRLKVRLVGGRFDTDNRTRQNIEGVWRYLEHRHVDIISADIYGGNGGPSAMVVDPHSFTLEERVPAKTNGNEHPANAVLLFTRQGKPLITQFDYTQSPDRHPIRLSARMRREFQTHCFGRNEAELETYLASRGMQDRTFLVSHLLGMEEAHQHAWQPLQSALEQEIATRGVPADDAAAARTALNQQSFYVGEHADRANAPLYQWISKQLFNGAELNDAALAGVSMEFNSYQPRIPTSKVTQAQVHGRAAATVQRGK